MEELAYLAIEAQVTLLMQVQMEEKLHVFGNEEQLYRLISYLIVNAIQASKSGGKVIVFLERSEHYALLLEWNGIHLEKEPTTEGLLASLSAADVMQRRVETL